MCCETWKACQGCSGAQDMPEHCSVTPLWEKNFHIPQVTWISSIYLMATEPQHTICDILMLSVLCLEIHTLFQTHEIRHIISKVFNIKTFGCWTLYYHHCVISITTEPQPPYFVIVDMGIIPFATGYIIRVKYEIQKLYLIIYTYIW